MQKGREILMAMKERYPQYNNVAGVYCSPFLRCVQTISKMTPSFECDHLPIKICIEPSVCEFMAAEWYADSDTDVFI